MDAGDVEQRLPGRRLDDLAQVHDGDPVTHVLDDAQIVGDEEVGVAVSLLQLLDRLRIWAWTETSRDEVGSSKTMNSGPVMSARAIPMRCRWPPLNS